MLEQKKIIMYKTCIFALISIFVGSMFIGCSDNPTDNKEPPDSVIIPLAVGNYWTFEDISFNASGDTTGVDTTTLSIDSSAAISGRTVYYWRWDIAEYENYADLMANIDDGLYRFGTASSGVIEADEAELILIYPGSTGDTFIAFEEDFTITSTTSEQIVPAGTFICYEYTYSGNNRQYFAPDYGFIARQKYIGEYLIEDRKLIDYDISN